MPMLSDSIAGLEPVIEGNVDKNKDNSQDNQNTLLLDSQSMIVENDNLVRDPNTSQQNLMHSLEASSILQQKD